MQEIDIQKIAVIGAGTMGHGIAELAGLANFTVSLQDIREELVQQGYEKIEWSLNKLLGKKKIDKGKAKRTLDRITPTTSLKDSARDADFLIEAVPEKMSLKKEVFEKLDQIAPDRAILATNTSSLSITEISSVTSRANQVIGMHYFNPPLLIDLVEIVKGEQTSDTTLETTFDLARQLGKTPVVCKKDVRRFIVNNILAPFLDEPAWMVSRGQAKVEEIDSAMKYKEKFPMGPFELLDLIGIDVHYNLTLGEGLEIPPLLEKKVREKELGRKTDKGFYNYKKEGVNYSEKIGETVETLSIVSCIVNKAAWLIQNEVTTAEQIDLSAQLGLRWPEGMPCKRAEEIGINRIVGELDELKEKYGEDRYEVVSLLREMVESGGIFYK